MSSASSAQIDVWEALRDHTGAILAAMTAALLGAGGWLLSVERRLHSRPTRTDVERIVADAESRLSARLDRADGHLTRRLGELRDEMQHHHRDAEIRRGRIETKMDRMIEAMSQVTRRDDPWAQRKPDDPRDERRDPTESEK